MAISDDVTAPNVGLPAQAGSPSGARLNGCPLNSKFSFSPTLEYLMPVYTLVIKPFTFATNDVYSFLA